MSDDTPAPQSEVASRLREMARTDPDGLVARSTMLISEGIAARSLLRRLLSAHGMVEQCHHEGCRPWLSVGQGDGFDLNDADLALVLRLGAADDRGDG